MDIAILMASNCSVDAIFPNSDTSIKSSIIHVAGNFIAANYLKIQKNITDKFIKNDAFIFYADICSKLDKIMMKNLERCEKRLDSGFITNEIRSRFSDKIDKISSLGIRIHQMDLPVTMSDDIFELLLKLERGHVNDLTYDFSIYDAIIGNFSESNFDGDKLILSIHDDAYDRPRVETLASQLKPMDEKIDFIYTWKRMLDPLDFENIRLFFCNASNIDDIENLILPY